MLRRTAYVLVIVLLEGTGYAQVQLVNFECSLILIYIGWYMPFEIKLLNYLEMYNEINILVCAYHLFTFTEFNSDPDAKEVMGFSFLAFIGVNVLVNIGVTLICSAIALKYSLWKCNRRRAIKKCVILRRKEYVARMKLLAYVAKKDAEWAAEEAAK